MADKIFDIPEPPKPIEEDSFDVPPLPTTEADSDVDDNHIIINNAGDIAPVVPEPTDNPTPDPVLEANVNTLILDTLKQQNENTKKLLEDKAVPLTIKKHLRPVSKFIDIISRPGGAWFGMIGGESQKELLQRLEEYGYKPKQNEKWKVVGGNKYNQLLGYITFEVTNKNTGEKRYVKITPQDIGYKDSADFTKATLKNMLVGAKKGIKGKEYYRGLRYEAHEYFEPQRTFVQKALDMLIDFSINVYLDPSTYATKFITPKMTTLAKAAHKGLEAKSPAYKAVVAGIEYSKPVRDLRKAFGYFNGVAKMAKERARMMRGRVKSAFVRNYDPVIQQIKEGYRPLIKSYAAYTGKNAKEASKKLSQGMLLVSRQVRDAIEEGTKKNIDDLAKGFIDKQFPDMLASDKKQVYNLMKKIGDFYNDFADIKNYATGIKIASPKKNPYYVPLRRTDKVGMSAAEVVQKNVKKSVSAHKLVNKKTDDLLNWLKNHGELIDDDLPQTISADVYEHLQRTYRRAYFIDMEDYLGKYYPKIGEITANDLKDLLTANKDKAAKQLLQWKNNKVKKQLINKIEKLGFKLSGKNAELNAKTFLKKYDLFQFPQDLYKGKNPPTFIVDRQVSDMFRSYSKGIFSNDELSSISYGITKFFSYFKAMATTYNPYFWGKYLFTDAIQNIKGGVDPAKLFTYSLPRGYAIKMASAFRRKYPELLLNKTVNLAGKPYNLSDVIDVMESTGIWHRSRSLMSAANKSFFKSYIKELQTPKALKIIKHTSTKIRDSLSFLDDAFRTSLFLDRLEKNIKSGMKMLSPEELKNFSKLPIDKAYREAAKNADAIYDAALWVTKHMYSYDVTPFVKKYIRPFIPFIAWKLENGPEMAKSLFNLHFMNMVAKGRAQMQEYFPLSEETKKYGSDKVNQDWMYEINLPQVNPESGLKFYFSIPMPYRSLETIKAAEQAIPGLVSQTGPLGTIIGFIQKKGYYPDEYSTKGRYVPAPWWGAYASKSNLQHMIPNLYKVVYDVQDKNLYLYMREDIVRLFEGLVPTLRTISKFKSEPAVKLDIVNMRELSKYGTYAPTSIELERTGQKLVGKTLSLIHI